MSRDVTLFRCQHGNLSSDGDSCVTCLRTERDQALAQRGEATRRAAVAERRVGWALTEARRLEAATRNPNGERAMEQFAWLGEWARNLIEALDGPLAVEMEGQP